jgi:cysteine desulfurase / selenocysteine lyase
VNLSRRTFLQALGATATFAHAKSHALSQPDGVGWRTRFPELQQSVNGHPLAYLDSAATSLRPQPVIDALTRFYQADNANPSATLHTLARRAARQLGDARQRVATFLHAADANEVVFTRGTTEGINLVAATWGPANLRSGDEIVLTIAEHYSNLLPWRELAARVGATIRIADVNDDGTLSPSRVAEACTSRTRLVAFSHVSNVLGIINPAAEICDVARRFGALSLVDAAQSAPHISLDVRELGCDFLACSGHKLLGPMGTGVLWGRRALLDAIPPYQWGSNMAHEVDAASAQLEHGALKFQAGTPNVSGAVGLAAAIDVLDGIGFHALSRYDKQLVEYAARRFQEVKSLRVLGTMIPTATRIPVFTFTLGSVPIPHIVEAMDARGIAIRGGDMAALPLLRRFGVTAAARASLYFYTTTDEIDRFVEVLRSLSGPDG